MTGRLIERATAHYANLASSPRKIEIPEWTEEGEEESYAVYVTPLTLADKAKVRQFSKNSSELPAEICMLKCKNSEGKLTFSRNDKQHLLRAVDHHILERIANEIIGDPDSVVLEEYEKN